MRLTKLFMLTTGVLLTLVSIMLARSVLQEWRTVDAAQRGLQAMELSSLAMKIAEKASFERGPTNVVLGDGEPPDAAKRGRLTTARDASDAAFAAPLQILRSSTRPEHQAAAAQLTKAQDELTRARREVDRVAALPLGERTAPGTRVMRVPIDQMFGVIDTALEAVTILSADAERVYPELSQPLVGARLAAELREYAGRLGSQFTAPIGAQQPLGAEERRDIPVLIGRIEQLRHLIEVQARANPSDARVQEAIAEMNRRYFAIGLPFIASLTAAGTSGNTYGMDLAAFVARYVPEMASIVKLRDTLFTAAREGATARYAQARRNLLVDAAIGLAVLLIEISVFLLIRQRVLKPLLANTRAVVAIAQGKLDTPLPPAGRTDEIGDMQKAVAILKIISEEKHGLEAERERLIKQLQHASSVDFLTGLLNRRAFSERTIQQMALATRQQWPVALIIFDIDHFKAVNDQYGHASGDTVLAQIADIAKREFRTADTLARYGGEEFIALVIDCSAEAAAALADRVRAQIASAQFTSSDGEPFKVSASFGLAALAAAEVKDIGAFFQLADQALYRAKSEGRNRVVAV